MCLIVEVPLIKQVSYYFRFKWTDFTFFSTLIRWFYFSIKLFAVRSFQVRLFLFYSQWFIYPFTVFHWTSSTFQVAFIFAIIIVFGPFLFPKFLWIFGLALYFSSTLTYFIFRHKKWTLSFSISIFPYAMFRITSTFFTFTCFWLVFGRLTRDHSFLKTIDCILTRVEPFFGVIEPDEYTKTTLYFRPIFS